MAPTSALWEHPSESATSVAAAVRKPVSRGAEGETPWKRRSARIAAIRKRTHQASSSRRPQQKQPQPPPQGKSRSPMPPPPPAPRQRSSQDLERLSPAPADTATAAEAATTQHDRERHASLAHVMWRTLVLMHSNRLLALQVEALKRETSAFVCSVLSNPENRALLPPKPTTQQQQQQQPASS